MAIKMCKCLAFGLSRAATPRESSSSARAGALARARSRATAPAPARVTALVRFEVIHDGATDSTRAPFVDAVLAPSTNVSD
jgi:hypothetical protein